MKTLLINVCDIYMYSSKQPASSHNFSCLSCYIIEYVILLNDIVSIFFCAQEKRRPHKNGDKSVSVVRFIACYTTVDVVNKKV